MEGFAVLFRNFFVTAACVALFAGASRTSRAQPDSPAAMDVGPETKGSQPGFDKSEHRGSAHGALVIQKDAVKLDGRNPPPEGDEGPGCGGDEGCCEHGCGHGCGEHGCGGHGSCPWHSHHGWRPGAGFTFGIGYKDSRWDKFSPALDRGSLVIGLGFTRNYGEHFRGGINLHFEGPVGSGVDQENASLILVDFDGRYFFMDGMFRPFAGLAIGAGGYRAWSMAADSPTSITWNKNGSGPVFATAPALGLEVALGEHFAFDLTAKYWIMPGSQNWKLGGFQGGLNLSFIR